MPPISLPGLLYVTSRPVIFACEMRIDINIHTRVFMRIDTNVHTRVCMSVRHIDVPTRCAEMHTGTDIPTARCRQNSDTFWKRV